MDPVLKQKTSGASQLDQLQEHIPFHDDGDDDSSSDSDYDYDYYFLILLLFLFS